MWCLLHLPGALPFERIGRSPTVARMALRQATLYNGMKHPLNASPEIEVMNTGAGIRPHRKC
jgi:hypothetical protein